MAKLHDEWKVLPHGPLRELAPGLLTVVGQIPMPLGNFPRRMTVIALPQVRTAIFSPIPLADEEMKRIEALGAPAVLIVPNAGHRLDIRPYKARYPKAKVVAPAGGKDGVGEAVPVDATKADLGKAGDLILVKGTKDGEFALLVHHEGGTSLVTNDIIGNVNSPQGPGAWVMSRLMGFGPRPQVPRVARRMFISASKGLAAQLRDWAALPGLVRLIPSHGDIIDRPAPVLLRIADDLDR